MHFSTIKFSKIVAISIDTYFDLIVSFVFLFGLYSGISFYISDTLFIPYIICGTSSIYFFFKQVTSIKFYQIVPIIFLAIITFLGIILSDLMSLYFFERMKGFVQLIYSFMIAFLFFLNLRKWPSKKVSNLFMFFIILIIIGSYLEIHTDFKSVSDSFRETTYRGKIYQADMRDITFYGSIRPKLFTEEPSHVGKFFTLCLFVWFSLSYNKYRYILLLLLSTIGILIIRSPIIFIIIPLTFIIELFYRNNFSKRLNFRLKNFSIINKFLILLLFVTLLSIISFNITIERRYNQIIKGEDDSFNVRFTGPILVSLEVLKQYPIWGAGISGKEAIADIIDNVYYAVDIRYYSIYSFSTNILFSFIIYYGFLGSLLFIVGLFQFVKRIQIQYKLFLFLSFLIFGQTMGGFVSLRAWGYFFVIAIVANSYPYFQKESFNNSFKIKFLKSS